MSLKTTYGIAVAVLKDGQIYMSRRAEGTTYPKKWQFVNDFQWPGERTTLAASRIMKEQMDVEVNENRFHFATILLPEGKNLLYYVYMIHLDKDEIPMNVEDEYRSDWRLFSLEAACVLDVIPELRDIIKKLYKSKIKFEKNLSVDTKQLTQGEQLHLSKLLGPKMTRIV